MKKYLVIGSVVVVALVAVYVVGRNNNSHHPAHFNLPPEGITDPAQLPHYEHGGETNTYSFKVNLEQTGIPEIDARIQADMDTAVQSFVSDANAAYVPDPSAKWNMIWNGRVTERAGKMINYRLSGYTFSGGAHGFPTTIMYVWDTTSTLNPPSPVDISEVFTTGTDWMARLSTVSRELLLAGKQVQSGTINPVDPNDKYQFSAEEIAGGTTPDYENFSRKFSLEHPGIRIVFAGNQIGPSVIGEPEIVIPWDRVKDIVNMDILGKVHSE